MSKKIKGLRQSTNHSKTQKTNSGRMYNEQKYLSYKLFIVNLTNQYGFFLIAYSTKTDGINSSLMWN